MCAADTSEISEFKHSVSGLVCVVHMPLREVLSMPRALEKEGF